MEKARGYVHTFGEDVNTDVILPGKYLNVTDPDELASHCMESLDPEFPSKVTKGDVIVAGKNFGCGSSREHAPLAILYAGVSCVIADSFARIFYRNALNIGLPVLESPEAVAAIQAGDEVEVDFDSGRITDVTTGAEFASTPIPPFMQQILADGGLIAHVRKNRG